MFIVSLSALDLTCHEFTLVKSLFNGFVHV